VVERYRRPKQVGRLLHARRPSAKAPAYRPKGSATLIPNAHPAAVPFEPSQQLHTLDYQHTPRTAQGDGATQPGPCIISQILPHPHVSALLPAISCYRLLNVEREAVYQPRRARKHARDD
jgi:hypothetical protein